MSSNQALAATLGMENQLRDLSISGGPESEENTRHPDQTDSIRTLHARNLHLDSLPCELGVSEHLHPQARLGMRRSPVARTAVPITVQHEADHNKLPARGRRRYYGIRVGRQPGIFYHSDDAVAQLRGVSAHVSQVFETAQEVEEFMNHAPEDCRFKACADRCRRAVEYEQQKRMQQSAWEKASCDCCGCTISGGRKLCAACLQHPTAYLDAVAQRYCLLPEQKETLKMAAAGKNLFISGSAGSGKSWLARAITHYLKGLGLIVAAVAPGGVPATSIGGTTLRSLVYSYVGWTEDADALHMDELLSRGFERAKGSAGSATEVLVIDEISMLDSNRFTRLSMLLSAVAEGKENDNSRQPFGGAQVIVVGDFYQLPPMKPLARCMWCGSSTILDLVSHTRICPSHGKYFLRHQYAFVSPIWKLCQFSPVQLRSAHRQSDGYHSSSLDAVRTLGGGRSSIHVHELVVGGLDLDDNDCPYATMLHPKKSEADSWNQSAVGLLAGPTRRYRAVDHFFWHSDRHPGLDAYNRRRGGGTGKTTNLSALQDHEFEFKLDLKSGMFVLLLTDLDVSRGLVSGAAGVVVGWLAMNGDCLPKAATATGVVEGSNLGLTGDHRFYREAQIQEFAAVQDVVARTLPVVEFQNGIVETIFPVCAVQELGIDGPPSLLSRTQLPLVAGYGLSIQRSQGLTLRNILPFLAECDQPGQAYTALSRAQNRDGMRVMSIPDQLLRSPEVHYFMAWTFDPAEAMWLPNPEDVASDSGEDEGPEADEEDLEGELGDGEPQAAGGEEDAEMLDVS